MFQNDLKLEASVLLLYFLNKQNVHHEEKRNIKNARKYEQEEEEEEDEQKIFGEVKQLEVSFLRIHSTYNK
ncbi:CLUMA_CG018612, isoform A [Clunio marinus]|uniref:CLUMA_CG018612, isoform A n=1 Tax=Clunio marinus TaxID=568069 RepID=A0A1J1IZJ1_9DIPT|nr:CLUMA_CG018612, isoform A [Clunio marinus]